MRTKRIYLDHAAATPLDSEVFSAMKPYFTGEYANPSSIHADGTHARVAIDGARKTMATILHAHADEIVFTSGGTEGNNLAINGVAHAVPGQKGHIVTTAFEHHSVIRPIEALAEQGFRVTYVNPRSNGIVDPRDIKKELRPDTILVSVMYVNNEIGTIQPIHDIAKVIRESESKPIFHTDACQAPGMLPLDVIALGVDMMTINAHKMYGPKGVGALFVKRGSKLAPLFLGGGQELGIRSGTENTPGIVGMASAFVLSEKLREQEVSRLTALRDYATKKILETIPGSHVNGDSFLRLAGNMNISFDGIDSEQLVIELDARGISASSGAACTSSDLESGYVILSLGNSEQAAGSAVRFSLGRSTTKKELDTLIAVLPGIISKLRRFPRAS